MVAKNDDIKPISSFMLLALQVDGYCQAVSAAMQLNKATGPMSVELLRKFIDETKRVGEGGAFQKWPLIPDDASTTDLFAVASVLRSTMWAFLDEPSRGDVAAASQAFGLAAFHVHRHARPEVLNAKEN